MKIKDYFLTQEEFELKEYENYNNILKTQNLPENLDKYYNSDKYLSHSKDKSFLSNIYLFVQNLNFKYKLKIIRRYISKGNILDYGCGDGSFLNFIKYFNYTVQGIEPNQKAREIAKNKIGDNHIKANLSEIENNSIDVLTLWHVLEHIPNPEEILKELYSKLKENGILIIAIPNYASYDAKFYKDKWAAWDVPRHIFHYSKDGAIQFFKDNNFKVSHTFPLPFDSYFISLMSEKYKKNKFSFLRFPIIGAISNIKAMKDGNSSSVIYILKK